MVRVAVRAGRELVRRHVRDALRGDRIDGLTYVMTYRCNSRCVTCDIWKDPGDVSSELTYDELVSMVTGSRYLSELRRVNLTGGEPFLREDLVQIAHFFLDRFPGLELAIPTNGLLPPRIARVLGELLEGRDPARVAIGVSLDGLGETHDRVRGVAGNFDKCLALIRELTSRWPTLRVGVGMTLTPANLADVEGVFGLACDLKVGFTTRFAQESFYYHNDDGRAPLAGGWTTELKIQAHQALRRIRDRRFDGVELWARMVDPSWAFLTEAVERSFAPQRTHDCFSGTYSFFLDPFGKVFPCVMLAREMGSVRERPFDEIWESERARTVRDAIAGRHCNCWTECETLPSLARSISRSVRGAAGAVADLARGSRDRDA